MKPLDTTGHAGSVAKTINAFHALHSLCAKKDLYGKPERVRPKHPPAPGFYFFETVPPGLLDVYEVRKETDLFDGSVIWAGGPWVKWHAWCKGHTKENRPRYWPAPIPLPNNPKEKSR